MIVQAKCIAHAFESRGARQYFPGFTYPLDLSNSEIRKLCDLKTPTGKFVFEFDRVTANDAASGLYFCADCGTRFDTINLLGTHARQVHKKTGWEPLKPEAELEPEPEVEEVRPQGTNAAGDLRGISPLKCKGCGYLFPNLNLLMRHKPDCPGKPTEVVAQEVSEEVAQAPPA